ncbi:MAG: hemolysin family protein [Actinomycetota bacterium]|nr:hemolysin family protein [Actinomycetota bacterium]
MSGVDVLLLVLAALLVIAASALACLDAALSRVSRVRVEELVREQRRGAARLQTLLADPARYLNLLLLLRVLDELSATTLVSVVCVDTLGLNWRAVLLAAGVMTLVAYILIGVAPRTLGQQHPDAIALGGAGVAIVLTRVFGPLPRLLIALGNALTPGRGLREGPFASEAELRDLVDLAEQRNVIEHGERDMIHSVFELGDTIVREVMVPRTDIVFIERTKTLRQALTLALRSGFSRIPVVGGNADDVVGVVYLKDLVQRLQDLHEGERSGRVEEAMRSASFVPESKPVDELLREMQAQQIHMAVVIDEYGGTAGLVTIEDILEEIVGEIADEYDNESPPVETVDELTTRVTARLPVDDVNEMYGVALPTDEVETVGGLLASALGRVPIPGASVSLEGLTFTAEMAKGRRNRIDTVLITRPAGPERAPESEPEVAGSTADA